MSDQLLTATIKAAMKAAMKAKDKERLGTIRLIQAEFKRIEVDARCVDLLMYLDQTLDLVPWTWFLNQIRMEGPG